MPACTSGTKTAGTQLINSPSMKLIQESQGGESYKSKNPFDAYLEAPSDTFSAGLYVRSLPVRSGDCLTVPGTATEDRSSARLRTTLETIALRSESWMFLPRAL